MTGVLDLQYIAARSKMGALAREVDAEAGERADRDKELEVLALLIYQDLLRLIPVAAQARGVGLVLERQRAAVLWASPAVDLTPTVLELYDGLYDKENGHKGLQHIKALLRDRLDELRRLTEEERRQLRTGMYL